MGYAAGPFAYEEGIHLPFYAVHPDVKGGQDCRALTGHIDITPTLLALAGIDATKRTEIAGRDLPGKDLSTLFTGPGAADERTEKQSDDAEMRDQKGHMMFAPRPARERRGCEVRH